MSGDILQLGVAAGLVLAAVLVAAWLGLGLSRDMLVAAGRAAVQLTIVGAVIAIVFEYAALGGVFVLVMVVAAAATSGRRLRGVPRSAIRAGAAIAAGAATGLVPLLATGAFSTRPAELVPIAGILIGGAMVATSVTGTRTVAAVGERADELEARLLLGVPVRVATVPVVRDAIATGVVPVVDQTKAAGLVTLPGTFVGLILGGASPAEAARVQLVVLLSLVAVQLVAAIACSRLVVTGLTLPGERIASTGR